MASAMRAGGVQFGRPPPSPRLAAVSITRGTTTLARMPCPRSSIATTSASACSAALPTIGPTPPAKGRSATREPT